MAAAPASSRCRHTTCACTVEPSLAYCCEYCARADQQPATEERQGRCECGHPECRASPEGTVGAALQASQEMRR